MSGQPDDQLAPAADSPLSPVAPTAVLPVPPTTAAAAAVTSSTALLSKRLQADIARLDELEQAWLPLALRGDRDAADRILSIHRQRSTSLHLALAAATAAEKSANDAAAATGEIKIVVEYVDDWREVTRRAAMDDLRKLR